MASAFELLCEQQDKRVWARRLPDELQHLRHWHKFWSNRISDLDVLPEQQASNESNGNVPQLTTIALTALPSQWRLEAAQHAQTFLDERDRILSRFDNIPYEDDLQMERAHMQFERERDIELAKLAQRYDSEAEGLIQQQIQWTRTAMSALAGEGTPASLAVCCNNECRQIYDRRKTMRTVYGSALRCGVPGCSTSERYCGCTIDRCPQCRTALCHEHSRRHVEGVRQSTYDDPEGFIDCAERCARTCGFSFDSHEIHITGQRNAWGQVAGCGVIVDVDEDEESRCESTGVERPWNRPVAWTSASMCDCCYCVICNRCWKQHRRSCKHGL